MKVIVCTLVLLFSLTLPLMAQEADQPSQPESVQQISPEPQPAPLPDADSLDLDHPAIASTLSADNVTLPGAIGTLQRNELAYSVVQQQDSY